MWIPNAFAPSSSVHATFYDEEGRLKTFRPGTQGAESDDGSLAEANSLFATDAEYFGQVAPFLRRNKIKDCRRRNYIIQPGGACIYFSEEEPLMDPYGNGRVQYTAPSDRETFGHNSMDGSKLADPNGNRLQVGNRGASTGGGR